MKEIANHSERLKMNLQYFADDIPAEPIEPTEPSEPPETIDPVDPPQEPTEPQPDSFLEIKYNKEQIKLDKERAAELAQKGMNYDKAVERAKQEARDTYIAEQGYEWNGKRITTETEYKQALLESELMEKYKAQDLPDDVIQELIESKNFREQYTKQQEESAERAKQEEDYKAFLDTFPDTKPEDIPQSVWNDVNKGKSLVDAYTRFENQQLKEKLSKLTEQEKIEQQNQENAASSTGSVTGQGTAKATRYTREQVAKMSTDEVNKNWASIQESMKKWE